MNDAISSLKLQPKNAETITILEGDYLTDALHTASYLSADSVELPQIPSRNLDDTVI